MPNKLLYYILLTALLAAGVWGALQINRDAIEHTDLKRIGSTDNISGDGNASDFVGNSETPLAAREEDDDVFQQIETELTRGNSQRAAKLINENYSYLSSAQLERLKDGFIAQLYSENDLTEKKNTLLAASTVFDDLDIWKALSHAAVKSSDWSLAFKAQLRASELENDPTELERLQATLVKSSSYLRSQYEKNGDEISIRDLYQRLVDLHPGYPRYQLELANSHLRLNDLPAAKIIFSSLSYDPELGEIARQSLENIESQTTPVSVASKPEPVIRKNRAGDIVVPLVAAGSSFLIDTSIDRKRVRLLLDTGASITSLSTDLIARLNLQPTGQSIRLSTANGITRARLYRADSLQLGRLVLRNMVVAEIDLGRRSSFEGLLGTDALNQLNSDFSYLIDNQQNALIFRPR